MYTISTAYARIVIAAAQQRGIDPQQLLKETGLTLKAIEHGDSIDHGAFVCLLENAERELRDEPLGLLIGKRINTSVLGPVGTTVSIAPTIREGLLAMASFSQLHAGFIKTGLFAEPGGLTLYSDYLQLLGSTGRSHTESVAMLLQHYVESITGESLTEARYHMDFARPDYADTYAACIHGHIDFDGDRAGPSMWFPESILDTPSPFYNAEMWHQGQLLLATRLQALGQQGSLSYTHHLLGLLRSSVPPLPGLPAIAGHLHISVRSLNRRLHDEGTSYREIRMGVLDEWAQRYLNDTSDSVESIAASLGYRDAANFRRAFRNRFGCTPAQYREQSRS